MKKVVVAILAVAMMISMTGCGDSKYKKTSKKVIKAAESALDAEEASKKQKKAIQNDASNPSDEIFENACFCEFSEDDTSDFDLNGSLDEGDVKNLTVIAKSSEGSYIYVYVFETSDKDAASDAFDALCEEFDEQFNKKYFKGLAAGSDLEYGLENDEDDERRLIMSSEESNVYFAIYYKLEGTVITMACLADRNGSDLVDEYFDFMDEAGFPDLQEML